MTDDTGPTTALTDAALEQQVATRLLYEVYRVRNRVARDLRDLADRIERVDTTHDLHGVLDATQTAGTVTHLIMSALPNLGLDALIRAARDHDQFIRRNT